MFVRPMVYDAMRGGASTKSNRPASGITGSFAAGPNSCRRSQDALPPGHEKIASIHADTLLLRRAIRQCDLPVRVPDDLRCRASTTDNSTLGPVNEFWRTTR